MASIDEQYWSTSREEVAPPEVQCPIALGDRFGAYCGVTGIPVNQNSDRYVAVLMWLNVQGTKQYAYGIGYLGRGLSGTTVSATSQDAASRFGLPEGYDPMDTPMGHTIGVNVKALVFMPTPYYPGPDDPLWNSPIASDDDADVYINQTPQAPTPDASWVQVLSALPVAIS